MAAAVWDFLGDRGDPASHTRFSAICPRCFNTCKLLQSSIGVFRGCSPWHKSAQPAGLQDFPLRPINSHVITSSRRRASRGDQDPEGDSRLHTGTRFRIRRSRMCEQHLPQGGTRDQPAKEAGPRDGNEGGGSGSGSGPVRLSFPEPRKRGTGSKERRAGGAQVQRLGRGKS